MTIETLTSTVAHNHELLRERLPALLKAARIATEPTLREITTQQDAEREQFLGSPTGSLTRPPSVGFRSHRSPAPGANVQHPHHQERAATPLFRRSTYSFVASHRYLEPALMTAHATEATTTFYAGANTHEASEVFHVEHRGGHTGQRVELARYTVAGGDRRIVYGQRVDGVVRFLPDDLVVLVFGRVLSEDSSCRSRGRGSGRARADAVRPKRPNVTSDGGGAADEYPEDRS